MKDFKKQFLKTQITKIQDPFFYTTPQVRQQILEIQIQVASNMTFSNMFTIFLTAPLQTIVTSLQLSVKAHKQIYDSVALKSKQLTKLNTSITLQEKRKMELMIRAGTHTKPYTAPVYDGYRSAIKGLIEQGWKSFYKGFMLRCFHQINRFIAFSQLSLSENNINERNFGSHYFKIYLCQSIVSVLLNIFYIGENRYILQNNLQQFRVFRSLPKLCQKIYSKSQQFKGSLFHFLNTGVDMYIRYPLILLMGYNIGTFIFHPIFNSISLYYLSELITYPVSTAYKRFICQMEGVPGMIPLRYSSVSHCLRLTFSEEGFRGIYKGFGLYQLIIAIRLLTFTLISNSRRKAKVQ